MNEVTSLRNKYEDYYDWEEGEEYEDDDVDKWYKDATGYASAKGVGDLDYQGPAVRSAVETGRGLRGPGFDPSGTEGCSCCRNGRI